MSLFSASVMAQSTNMVKGKIVDTASTSILADASIALLNAKDSTLVKFTRSGTNGNFELGNIVNGKFILLVTYPKYAAFVDQITLDSTTQVKNYPKINLTGLANLLSDVMITGNRAAIKIKGDTTIFDPKAYNIEPNSKIEDLIKQFPGFQVDKDGKITAQGKSVPKVLVDGEEFFGDDPTLVTKNLRADMVESIQLYDKTSDQAAFTGIDDGEKTKTLNIKLKEDKKNGYFGKADVGYGTDNFYQGQLAYNKFWGKKKFSAYGILSNTGKIGLGWDDRDRYGSGSSSNFSDDGFVFYSGGGDDFESYDGRYSGEGIPIAKTGGLHFDTKWNKDKESLNTNYKLGKFSVSGDRNTISQNNLKNSVLNNVSDQNNANELFRQKLDFQYEIKIDTTLTLKINVDGTLKNSNTLNNYNSSSRNGNNELLNTNVRALKNEVDDQQFNMNAFFTKKLKKKGRTLSLNLKESFNKSNSNGTLNSDSKFYDNLGNSRDSVINQLKVNDISNSSLASNLVYTEPISKNWTANLSYGLSLVNGKSDRRSFNNVLGAGYIALDTLFSNNYELNQTINQAGAILNYKNGKTTVNFGSKFSDVNFKQKDVFNEKTYARNFINYNPQASYQYRFSQQKSFRFSYNGSSNQPSLDQIQPVRVNTDPLNISLGNPNLRPSYRSNLSLNYNSYKVLTNENIYFGVYGGFTANPIVSDVTTDAIGKSTYRSVNIGDKLPSNFGLYGSLGRKIKALDLNVQVSPNISYNSSYNYINGSLNNTENQNYSLSVGLSKYKNKKYSFNINAGPSYNISTASVNNNRNSNAWGAEGYASGEVQLPAKIEISTDLNYTYNGKSQVFDKSFERLTWNASLAKKFFKTENLKAQVQVYDLLNQNVGFDRSAYNGNITQSSYTTIKRYFMFSLIWDFTKMGGGDAAKK